MPIGRLSRHLRQHQQPSRLIEQRLNGGLSVNINPETTRILLVILAVAVVAILAFTVLTKQYGDPARDLIERETPASKR